MDQLGATKTVREVAYKLYLITESTRVPSPSIKRLYIKTNLLESICNAVEKELNRMRKHPTGEENDIIDLVLQQLAQCVKLMQHVDHTISPIYEQGHNLEEQGLHENVSQMDEEAFADCRSQIVAHAGYLQIGLLLMILQVTYLGPKLVTENLWEVIGRLEHLIEKHGHNEDTPLMYMARRRLHEASTLYEGSFAEVFVAPRSDPSEAGTTFWIDDMQELPREQPTIHRAMVSISESENGPGSVSAPSISTSLYEPIMRYHQEFQSQQTELKTEQTKISGDVKLSTTPRPGHVDTAGEHGSGIDLDNVDVEFEAAINAVHCANNSFQDADYEEADDILQDALEQIKSLPANQQAQFTLGDIFFKLATCTFHLRTSREAEPALLSLLESMSNLKVDSYKHCTIDHLLSQTYIRNGKLDLARVSCNNTYEERRRLFGQAHESCYESLALLSRIHYLLEMHRQAESFLSMIPATERVRFRDLFKNLKPNSSNTIDGASIASVPLNDTSSKQTDRQTFSGKSDQRETGREISALPLMNSSMLSTEKTSKIMRHRKEELWSYLTLKWALRKPEILIEKGGLRASWSLQELDESIVQLDLSAHMPSHTMMLDSSDALIISKTGAGIYRLDGRLSCDYKFERATERDALCFVTRTVNADFVASCAANGDINVWNEVTGEKLWSHNDPECHGWIRFSPDDKLLAVGSEYGVKIWSVSSPKILHDFRIDQHRQSSTRTFCFSADGEYILASGTSQSQKVFVVALDGSKSRGISRPSLIHDLTPSHVRSDYCGQPGGRIILAIIIISSEHIHLFDLSENRSVILRVPGFNPVAVAFSRCGRWLATVMNRNHLFARDELKICVWDVYKRLGINQ